MRSLGLLAITTGLLLTSFHSQAQLVSESDDESKLYAETKQLNQFFRRFNGEEDEKGNRYYAKDKEYRSVNLRKKYLPILFDKENASLSRDLKVEFADQVLDKKNPAFLNFHDNNWFAEVNTIFMLKGKAQPFTLYLQLEKQNDGSKWVIYNVYSPYLAKYFDRDTSQTKNFLHPMSHELDFMNFRKAFDHSEEVAAYTNKDYQSDQVSIFIYEIKNGNLKFQTVTSLNFHLFQLDGWYLQLSEFNRPGYNRGWLISDLVKVNNEEKGLLKSHIMHEK
ncbi:hypothetical protein [Fulvivirga lutimaris]|uniref:hypothetical protein n=1 Tax=Fulvivirga lutimaris TaxID=1819566 RepID=UPI0012BBEDA1|nr:hypothetical protein [Fulvivirga lutimaris]MTI39373.1 hypothetical protein [Fulvivirga lutimaris]